MEKGGIILLDVAKDSIEEVTVEGEATEEENVDEVVKVITFAPNSSDDNAEDTSVGPTDELKTVVLCIYNINQNGTANTFKAGLPDYLASSDSGLLVNDMTPEALAGLFAELAMAKKIKLPDLKVRLVLLIYNCNQNGVSNLAEVSGLEPSKKVQRS